MRRRSAVHRLGRMPREVLASAVTMAEIQRRLQREAVRSTRPLRVVTVVARPLVAAR